MRKAIVLFVMHHYAFRNAHAYALKRMLCVADIEVFRSILGNIGNGVAIQTEVACACTARNRHIIIIANVEGYSSRLKFW